MYVVSVIPLAKIPHPAPQTLDYFSMEEISPGGIVQISLVSRKILGVVAACTPLYERKQQIKKSAFHLKKIDRVVSKNPLVPRPYLKLALWSASYFYSPLGHVMRSHLPPTFSKPTEKLLADLTQIEYAGSSSAHITSAPKKPILYWARSNTKSKAAFYRHAIQQALARKQSVLFLVPELYKIAQFREKIPEVMQMEAVHSTLSPAAQYKIWKGALRGELQGVIGTRRALTTPFCNLGLIIVDEEESFLYKSFDQRPYISAKTAALKLAELTGAEIILGSSLPSVESLWQAKKKKYQLVTPPSSRRPASDIAVIDMRDEIKNGNFSIFSRELQARIKETLEKNRQAILYISRKGLSSGLVCRDCGHVVMCTNCDVPLVLHQTPVLICHHCGQKQKPTATCPKCQSYRIKFIGAGTERVEQEVRKLCEAHGNLKNACRVIRLDKDSAPTWEQQSAIFNDFSKGKYNILIGTQLMLKEGLLPKVDFAAIVTVDSLLSLPDFRIGEQILRTVDKLWTTSKFRIIFQTYIIDSTIIQFVSNKLLWTSNDYSDVLNNFLYDIDERRELSLPPFSQLIKLTYAHKDSQKAEQEANILKNKLHTQMISCQLPVASCQILGPSPAFIPREKGRYIWQIVLKSKIADLRVRNKLLRIVPNDWKIDVDPIELL